MADIILKIDSKDLRADFDDSTLSDEKPTDEEWEEYIKYLLTNQREAFRGMMLDFWCQWNGRG